ncbi:MAG TPA: hypothetical protein DDW34_02815 [Clostridium sp.]|nr:hypothetical protein [Clostridium sp.]
MEFIDSGYTEDGKYYEMYSTNNVNSQRTTDNSEVTHKFYDEDGKIYGIYVQKSVVVFTPDVSYFPAFSVYVSHTVENVEFSGKIDMVTSSKRRLTSGELEGWYKVTTSYGGSLYK